MRKGIVAICAAAVIVLCGCAFFKTDEEEYKTPELFFSHFEDDPSHCIFESSKKDNPYRLFDWDGQVFDELSKIKDYEPIDRIEDPSEVYLVYGYIQPATSGPNIASMKVYSNGYFEIHRKQSLGSHHYYYYSIDADLAYSLNCFVEDRIDSLLNEEEEKKAEATKRANIENFLKEAKAQSQVQSICYGERTYDFLAKKDVVELMEGLGYSLKATNNPLSTVCLRYNGYGASALGNFPWAYELSKSYDEVRLIHCYESHVGEGVVSLSYEVDKTKGKALYDYAYSYAKDHNLNGI